jgi:hypothetical protein
VPEILSQLDRKKFSALDPSNNPETSCSICLVSFKSKDEVTVLQCNERHIYHTMCIESWIKKGKNSCPLCKRPIVNLHERVNQEEDDLI